MSTTARVRNPATGAALAGILALLSACDDRAPVGIGDAGHDAGSAGDTGRDTEQAPGDAAVAPWKVSNLPAGFPFDTVEEVFAEGANCVISAVPDAATVASCLSGAPTKQVVKLSDGRDAVVYTMKSLFVRASAQVFFEGDAPVILAVSGRVTIRGQIVVGPRAPVRHAAAAGGAPGGDLGGGGRGPGGGGAGDSTSHAGAAGGSFCGTGGPGEGAGGSRPATYGTPALIPLAGGSGGGGGSAGRGGSGGGALEIVALEGITVEAGGAISAPGGGGVGGGGGGAGGAILLEAPEITIAGMVAANGGGGGGNGMAGTAGEAGQPSTTAANGGMEVMPANSGGAGSAGYKLAGSPGRYDQAAGPGFGDHGGGGGGGAGRVRVNTMSGAAKITSFASPEVGTSCFTQGLLAP
jgi:hypothetical protein